MLPVSIIKKISILVLFQLLCLNIVFAATDHQQKNKVLLVVADHGRFQTKQYQAVQNVINEKLPGWFTSAKYDIVRDDAVLSKLYELSGDPDIDSPEKLKQSDFVNFGNKNEIDYIVFMEFKPTDTRLENLFTIVSQRVVNLELAAKVVDVKAGNYLYHGNVTSGTVSRLGILMFSNDVPMWSEAVQRCLTNFNQACPVIPALKIVDDTKIKNGLCV